MSDDLTERLPGGQDSDRISALIGAVESMGADFHEVKVQLEALQKTVNDRLYDTKPIWERALAEIADTRAELKTQIADTRAELKTEIAETRAELRSEMRDGFRMLGSKMDVLNEDVLTVRAEQRLLGKRVQDLESKAS
jgi:F0F1-type ATP synthase membrane subunit b/b'